MKKNTETKVLVTGANGFIGTHLCLKLRKAGYKVFGLYHNKVDITSYRSVSNIFKKIRPNVIFHTAALLPKHPLPTFDKFFTVNVLGTTNILQACVENKIDRLIQSSSMSVYGLNVKNLPVGENDPLHPYDMYSLTKKISEDVCKFYSANYNMNIVILRYCGIFGIGKETGAVFKFIKNALKDKPLVINTNMSWDILYLDDVAEANLLTLNILDKNKFNIINIGSGRETNIVELAKKIKSLTNSKSLIIKDPSFKKYPSRFYFDISKAKKVINFKPTTLDDGLSKFVYQLQQ